VAGAVFAVVVLALLLARTAQHEAIPSKADAMKTATDAHSNAERVAYMTPSR